LTQKNFQKIFEFKKIEELMELFVGGWLDCELSVLEMRAAFYREKEGSGTLLLRFCAHILTCIAAQEPRIIPPSSFLLFFFFFFQLSSFFNDRIVFTCYSHISIG
jgi:hypothetical protein